MEKGAIVLHLPQNAHTQVIHPVSRKGDILMKLSCQEKNGYSGVIGRNAFGFDKVALRHSKSHLVFVLINAFKG